jgi:hypothetical protein
MNAIARSARELWGLFVEDASFTIGILASVVLAAVVFPRIGVPNAWRGPGLFLLMIVVLLENVIRSSRSARMPKDDQ